MKPAKLSCLIFLTGFLCANLEAYAAAYPLCEAAKAGDLQEVKALIAKGADPNHFDESGKAALHLAAEEGHKDVLAYLLDHKAKINLQDSKFQETALTEAAQFGRLEVVKLLLDKGAAVDLKGKYGGTALSAVVNNIGVASGKTSEAQVYEIISLLLSHGANPNAQKNDGETMLHMPAFSNQLKLVSTLLKGKINTGLMNQSGENALDYCCRGKGDLEMYELLSQAGFKPAKGLETCLNGAIEQSKTRLVKRLLELTKPAPQALANAAAGTRAADEDISLLLLAKVTDINVPSYGGLTALQGAAITNKLRLCQALLQKHAKLDHRGNFFCQGTALHMAARFGHQQIVKLLLVAGANPNEKNNNNDTPLTLAIQGPIDYQPSDGPPPDWSRTPDYMQVIELLLSKGAKVSYKNNSGQSAAEILKTVKSKDFQVRAGALLAKYPG